MVNRVVDFLDGLPVALAPGLPRVRDAAAEATRSSTPSFPCINSSALHLAGGEAMPLVPTPLLLLLLVDMARVMVNTAAATSIR